MHGNVTMGKVVHLERGAGSNVKKQILMLPKRIYFNSVFSALKRLAQSFKSRLTLTQD